MSEHDVYIQPQWANESNDVDNEVGCRTCGWQEKTVTVAHAQLIAAKHLMGESARGRRRRE